jgi:hypothetical protein
MSLQPVLIGLVSESASVNFSDAVEVAGALQRQGIEDLQPAWTHATAVVQAFPTVGQVLPGYWPIIVRDDIDAPGAAGYHSDTRGNPYALVAADSTWSFTASHEFLEMACDPFGSRLYRAPSPDPDAVQPHPVEILLELGDPCEAYCYTINGVQVSDFILHQYGNGHTGPYDRLGLITKPREVLDGGYLSWRELTGEWKQLTNFGTTEVVSLGWKPAADHRSLREWVAAQRPDQS